MRAHRERSPVLNRGRRRTPGLRREELAERAGISATWCAWIEQGREVQASPQALSRLAVALNLSRAERSYLFQLAGRRDPDFAAAVLIEDAPASLQAVVSALAHPAYGLDRLWNACGWNESAEQLFAGWLGEGRQKNLLCYVFLDPSARELIPHWENRARRLLAEYRADYSRYFNDSRTRSLVDGLRKSSALFAASWEDQEVLSREGGFRAFAHPAQGLVEFMQYTFTPADQADHKLVVLKPAGPVGYAPFQIEV